MIDRAARGAAIVAIRRFLDLATTNDDFLDELADAHRRADRAIGAISWRLKGIQDDLNQHKLTGRHALSAEGRRFMDRCIVFLASDVEYVAPPGPLDRVVAAVRGLKLPPGTPSKGPWWPFASRDIYRAAVETLGRAQAVERGVEAEYDQALVELAGAAFGPLPG